MGDPRGFLKVRTRRELAERPVEERIKDWFDVHAESGLQPWTTEQAVSYTHLDVYKRQRLIWLASNPWKTKVLS